MREAGKRCGAYEPTSSDRLTYNSPYSDYERLARVCAESDASATDKDAAAKAWKAFKATYSAAATAKPLPKAKGRAAPLSPSRQRLAAYTARMRPKVKAKAAAKAKVKAAAKRRARTEEGEGGVEATDEGNGEGGGVEAEAEGAAGNAGGAEEATGGAGEQGGEGGAERGFRMRGKSFLITYNYRFFSRPFPDGTPACASPNALWLLWKEWLAGRVEAIAITTYTLKMEESLNSPDEKRVHIHLKVNFKDIRN